MTIEGHTDSIGSEVYNDDLSIRRAKATERVLLEHGIDAERLDALGLGESTPLADNATKEGRRQNRRVEVIVQ